MDIKLVSNDGSTAKIQVSGHVTREPNFVGDDPIASMVGPDAYKSSVLVDMSRATHIDSLGVGWLLGMHQRYDEHGGQMILHSAPPTVNQLLYMMRMNLVLNICNNETDAAARTA